MDSIDNFRERFEALEQRTEQLQQHTHAFEAHTHTVERRLCWWRYGLWRALLDLVLSCGNNAPFRHRVVSVHRSTERVSPLWY
jgi:hypothetical protein